MSYINAEDILYRSFFTGALAWPLTDKNEM